MKTLFVVGGTWETEQWGLCRSVVDNLPDEWEPIWVPYPAKYGSRVAYKDSYGTGRINLHNAIEKISGEFSILGYSQGAKIGGDVGQQNLMNPNLIRVYGIADPERHTDDELVGPRINGMGVAGQRRIGWKARQFAAEGDIVCANTNTIFEYIAGATATLDVHSPAAWIKTLKEVPVRRGNPVVAYKQADRFLKTKVHTSYDKYEVSAGITVPQWILKDLGS